MTTKSNIMIAIAIIAVGGMSFISGRLSIEEKKVIAPVAVKAELEGSREETMKEISVNRSVDSDQSPSASLSPISVQNSGENLFVASKAGQKYFPIACGSAKTIKKENAIYFKTTEEAELSGRTKSVQCKY